MALGGKMFKMFFQNLGLIGKQNNLIKVSFRKKKSGL